MITLSQDSLVYFDWNRNEPVIIPFVGKDPMELR
jgi:hypothetical protein